MIFSILEFKTLIVDTVLTSIHILCVLEEKNVYSFIHVPKFYYNILLRFKGVYFPWTCFPYF